MKVHLFLKVIHLQFLKEIPTSHGTPFSLRSLLGALKHGFLKAALQPPEVDRECSWMDCLEVKGPPAFHHKLPSAFLTEPNNLPLKSFMGFQENIQVLCMLKYILSRPEGN